MKKNRIIGTVVAAVLALSAVGCGGSTGASVSGDTSPAQGSTEGYTSEIMPGSTASTGVTSPGDEAVADDYQNPIMNYVGAYSDENGKGMSMLVQATDEDAGVYITIGSAEGQEYYIWDIYGSIDGNVIKYTQGGCYKLTPDPESETGAREESVYEDGTGTFTITEDNKITWTDNKENKGDGVVFAWDEALNSELSENASAGQN